MNAGAILKLWQGSFRVGHSIKEMTGIMARKGLRWLTLAFVAGAVLATGGCSKIRESVGLTKNPPDEFRVVSHRPLEMPPEFELRPPEPGAQRPQGSSPRSRAEQTVFRRNGETDPETKFQDGTGLSHGEQAFLSLAGAQGTNDDIRQTVNTESERLQATKSNLINRLVFWQEPQDPATVVDAEQEARRLRENTALGRDVTEGRTPTIERRERGFLGGLLPGLL